MRSFRNLLRGGLAWGGIALIGLSFLAPKYETSPQRSSETLVDIRLSASGELLLLRTKEHDYEFSLPQNRLSEMPAPSETASFWLLFDNPDHVTFGLLSVAPDGAASANVEIQFGGYDSGLPETKTILSEEMREHLKELGFSPSNRNVIGDFEPPLYMVWRRDLVGRQYPVLSRSSDAGRVIESWCCSSVNYIEITEDDQAKLARNSRINFVLAPLHEIRDAIQDLLRVPFLLILWLMGFRSGA